MLQWWSTEKDSAVATGTYFYCLVAVTNIITINNVRITLCKKANNIIQLDRSMERKKHRQNVNVSKTLFNKALHVCSRNFLFTLQWLNNDLNYQSFYWMETDLAAWATAKPTGEVGEKGVWRVFAASLCWLLRDLTLDSRQCGPVLLTNAKLVTIS